jgi:hypothetical protein
MVDGEMIVLNDELDIRKFCHLIYPNEIWDQGVCVYSSSQIRGITAHLRHPSLVEDILDRHRWTRFLDSSWRVLPRRSRHDANLVWRFSTKQRRREIRAPHRLPGKTVPRLNDRIGLGVLDAGWLPAGPACVTDPAKICRSATPAPSTMTISDTFKGTVRPLPS